MSKLVNVPNHPSRMSENSSNTRRSIFLRGSKPFDESVWDQEEDPFEGFKTNICGRRRRRRFIIDCFWRILQDDHFDVPPEMCQYRGDREIECAVMVLRKSLYWICNGTDL